MTPGQSSETLHMDISYGVAGKDPAGTGRKTRQMDSKPNEHEYSARELQCTAPKADGRQPAHRLLAFGDLLEGRVERGVVKL